MPPVNTCEKSPNISSAHQAESVKVFYLLSRQMFTHIEILAKRSESTQMQSQSYKPAHVRLQTQEHILLNCVISPI